VRFLLRIDPKPDTTSEPVPIDPGEAKILAEGCQSNFPIFICNPQADATIKNQLGVSKSKGVENLTDVSIGLSSTIHKLSMHNREISPYSFRRFHHAVCGSNPQGSAISLLTFNLIEE
jgi:hypothetical protein